MLSMSRTGAAGHADFPPRTRTPAGTEPAALVDLYAIRLRRSSEVREPASSACSRMVHGVVRVVVRLRRPPPRVLLRVRRPARRAAAGASSPRSVHRRRLRTHRLTRPAIPSPRSHSGRPIPAASLTSLLGAHPSSSAPPDHPRASTSLQTADPVLRHTLVSSYPRRARPVRHRLRVGEAGVRSRWRREPPGRS